MDVGEQEEVEEKGMKEKHVLMASKLVDHKVSAQLSAVPIYRNFQIEKNKGQPKYNSLHPERDKRTMS